MSKKVKATNTTNGNIATTEETVKTPFQRKKDNTIAALKRLMGKLKGVKFLGQASTKINAFELCERILGPKADILIPDFQRAPYTFKPNYMDRMMSGVITELSSEISRIVIAIYEGKWYIVDGLQRCSAFYHFLTGNAGFFVIEDDLKTPDTLEVVYKASAGKENKQYEIEGDLRKIFENFQFSIAFVECESMDQMRDIFMAINTSTSVSSTAKINSYACDPIRQEVKLIMENFKDEIAALPVKNINGKNNGDAVVNQEAMIRDFFLMCAYPDKFTGKRQERTAGSIVNFSREYSRIQLSEAKMAKARTLFNKSMKLMGKLCIDASKKNITTYRIAFILILNIIKEGKMKYFKEANTLSEVLVNMTVLPTTSGQCASLTQMYEKQIDLYYNYILPYIDKIDINLEETYNSPDDDDDDKFVA